jgi:hypothetical protein
MRWLSLAAVCALAACSDPTGPIAPVEVPSLVIPLPDVRSCQPIVADTAEQSGYSRCAVVPQ